MKLPLCELISHLDDYLESSSFSDHGPNGLQIEGKPFLKKVPTAVSANLETIAKCVSGGFDALVVHHGLFWNGEPYPIVGSLKQKVELLLSNGISLMAYHLPLDAHREVGNNWKGASDLGWKNLEPFGEYRGKLIGVKGTFKAQSVDAFTKSLEKYYGHKATVALGGREKITTAALISGGAYREVRSAARCGVDAFVTGNFDEPAWGWAHEEGIHFFALGHTATEKVGPKAIAAYVKKRFGIPTQFLETKNTF